MAGRKPKPTTMNKLEGNLGKRKLNTKEPVQGKGMPDCSRWLLPEAKEEWNRLCQKLSEMGVLTEIDTTVSATATTVDEIISLSYSLRSPYRRNAKFLMNDAAVAMVRKLKDKNDAYLWQPSLQVGEPDRLLGCLIYTSSYAPTVASEAYGVFQPEH